MALWRGNDKPALTRSAEKISTILSGLDDVGQARAVETVRALIEGIRGLGGLPDDLTVELWTMLLTVARKAIVGASADAMFGEVRAGLSPEFVALVERESRR